MRLHPHQSAAINAVREAIDRGLRAGLVAMPTGTGKTVMFGSLAAELGWRTLVLVHRVELVEQTVRTFRAIWPDARIGIVHAERDDWRDQDVVVAMVPTLHARRLDAMPRDLFRLVVVDEAHHVVAETWRHALDHFQADFVLGVTATPERGDGRGLVERFGERPIYTYSLRQAIVDEQLARLRQYAIKTETSLDEVAYRAGDFADADLSQAVNTPERNRVVVDAFARHAHDRRAIAFCVDVAHALDLAAQFQSAGISAATVTGQTALDDRRNLLADFAAGRIQVMTNCAVLTEGFDDPSIDAVLMARPTTSRGLYTQCIGRGLRLAPGKSDCLVFDFADNSSRHRLVTSLNLLGAVREADAAGGDVIQVADLDRDRAERERIVATTRPLRWRLQNVCPWPEMPTLAGYTPSEAWHPHEATEKQVRYLEGFGVQVTRTLTKGEASYLIHRLLECDARHPLPASGGQVAFIKRLGGTAAAGLTRRDATRMIRGLQAQEWAKAKQAKCGQGRGSKQNLLPLRALVTPESMHANSVLGKARRVAGKRDS